METQWKPDGRALEQFEASVGGYAGASYSVALEGSRLVYDRLDYGFRPVEQVTFEPSADALAHFSRALDDLDVWSWAQRYEDSDVIDGTQWRLEVADARRRAKSSGSNAYPPRFDEFCSAVSELIGGRTFR